MVRFLLNPASGRGTGAAHLHRLRILASRVGAGLVASKSAADLAEQARRAATDGVERLIVAVVPPQYLRVQPFVAERPRPAR